MTQITITSERGTTIVLEITGTPEEPVINAPLFSIGTQTVYGMATMQESLRSAVGSSAGLLFHTPRNIYVQCADEMSRIRAAIAGLPHKSEVE